MTENEAQKIHDLLLDNDALTFYPINNGSTPTKNKRYESNVLGGPRVGPFQEQRMVQDVVEAIVQDNTCFDFLGDPMVIGTRGLRCVCGCCGQFHHLDFPKTKKYKKCLSVLIAVDPQTPTKIQFCVAGQAREVIIPYRAMLCWDATTAHGGSAYKTRNDRLFFHVVHRRMCIAEDKNVINTAEDPADAQQDIVYSQCKCGDHPVPEKIIDLREYASPTPPQTPKKAKLAPSTKSVASPEGKDEHDFLTRRDWEMHVDDKEYEKIDSDGADYDPNHDPVLHADTWSPQPESEADEDDPPYVPDHDTTSDTDESGDCDKEPVEGDCDSNAGDKEPVESHQQGSDSVGDRGKAELCEWTYTGPSGDEELPQRAVLPTRGMHIIHGRGTIESDERNGSLNFRVDGQEKVLLLGSQHIKVDFVKEPRTPVVAEPL